MALYGDKKLNFDDPDILHFLKEECKNLIQDDMKDNVDIFFNDCDLDVDDGKITLHHENEIIELTDSHLQNFVILAPLIYQKYEIPEEETEVYKMSLGCLPRGQQKSIMIDLALYIIDNELSDDHNDPLRLSSLLEYELIRVSNPEKDEIREKIFISGHDIIMSEEVTGLLLKYVDS